MAESLSIILPIFNERENIEPVLTEVRESAIKLGVPFEIIAVDDGSTDGSVAALENLRTRIPELKIVALRRNYGQTAAFDAGIRHATGSLLVTMDSDGQNDPRDFQAMMDKISQGYDFVAGWREKRKDAFMIRKLPSKIANGLIRLITATKFKDLGCSLKMYRSEVVKELRLYGEMHRFIGVLMEDLGARSTEIPVNHRPRHMGQSKYGIVRTFKVVIDLITVWFFKGFHTKPSYVFGGVGMLFIFISALAATFVLYQKIALEVWVHRNPLFSLSAFFGIVGVQFLGLGVLAELLVRTYFEGSNRLPYLVKKKVGFTDSK